MSDELKPCQHCKSANVKLECWEDESPTLLRGECLNCGYAPDYWCNTEEDAIRYWNQRPFEDALLKRAEESEDYARTLNKEFNRVGNASYAKDLRISQLEEVNDKLKSKILKITDIAMGNGNALSVALLARAERAERKQREAESMVERLIEVGNMLDRWVVHFRSKEDATTATQINWHALVAEWQAQQ